MRKVFLVLFIGLGFLQGYSQSGDGNYFNSYYTDPYANIVPQTPNAANFTVYGDTPVNTSSGLPSISIPIFTIEEDGVQVPISLTYHASGVKVDDIASAVGLKWALNAGGGVYRTVNDIDDFKQTYGWTEAGSYSHFDNWLTTHPYFDYSSKDQQENFLFPHVSNFDNWPDDFNYSFLDYSGDFMFNPDGIEVIKSEKDKLQIDGGIGGFTAFDQNGNSFLFGHTETNATMTRSYIEGDDTVNFQREEYNVSWMLSEITTKNQKTINFLYEPYEYSYDRNPASQRMVSSYNCAPTACSFPLNCTEEGNSQLMNDRIHATGLFNETTNMLIKKIYTDNIEVEFIYTNAPIAGVYVDGWDIRLEKIVIKDKINTKQKEFHFKYGYFDGPFKRLKLTEVYEKGFDQEIKPSYYFTYNESNSLPAPGSFSKDYKGYYNGKINPSLFPKTATTLEYKRVIILDPNSPPVTFYPAYELLADRYFDPGKLEIGILKEIKYPTGGKTEFIYEPNAIGQNTYEHLIKGNNETYIANFGSYFHYSGPYYSQEDAAYEVYNNLVRLEDFVGQMEMESIMDCPSCYEEDPSIEVPILRLYEWDGNNENENLQGYDYEQIDDKRGELVMRGSLYKGGSNNPLYLGFEAGYTSANLNGVYLLQLKIRKEVQNPVGLPSPEISVYFNWHTKVRDSGNFVYQKNYYGGLRIKEIKDYDTNNEIYNHKKFNYISGFEGNYSGIDTNYNIQNLANQNIFSTEKILLPGSNLQTGYFYGEVETEYFNGNESNGKIIEKYNGTSSFKSIKGGNLKERKVLNENGELLEITENIYTADTHETLSFMTPSLMEYAYDEYFICSAGNWLLRPKAGYSNPGPEYEFDYTTKSRFLTSQKTTEFFKRGSTYYPITTIKSYEYNENLLVTDEVVDTRYTGNLVDDEMVYTQDNSDGEIIEVAYTYPTDHLPELDYLKNKGLIALPVSKEVENNSLKILGQFFEYDSYGNISKTYHYNKGGHTNSSTYDYIPDDYEEMTSYVFDDGKPVQVQNKGGSPTSYIWGYENQYLVAKIEGIAYSAIPSGLISDIQSASNESNLNTALNALRAHYVSSLSGMVTTYTYSPLVGVTSITDPKGDKIDYEYDEFGRLVSIKDAEGYYIEEYDYHYGE